MMATLELLDKERQVKGTVELPEDVFGAERSRSSTSSSLFSFAFALSAERSAAFITFRFTLIAYPRGWGPNTVPPPRSSGERVLPMRALPVPFCRNGFFPPPETSFLVFVDAVPERRAASCATTA